MADTALISAVRRHAPWLFRLVADTPWLSRLANRAIINGSVGCTRPRPLPFTLWTGAPIEPNAATPPRAEPPSDYVTWAGLTDRRFTGRHLPPRDAGDLPPIEDVLALYERATFRPSRTTSALLCFFAQWFTDSFLRTHPIDRRLNTSNHEIDLCQIYGLDAPTARLLRTCRGGRLRASEGGWFPDRLFDDDGRLHTHYAEMPYMRHRRGTGQSLEDTVLGTLDVPEEEKRRRRAGLYATGLERGNSTILYTAISTIFLREHNRLCGVLAQANPHWDDDRLFEIARNVNIAMVLKLVVGEYINHLAQAPLPLSLDRSFAETRPWYRTNRIAIEFDLLYRWHSLVPDSLEIGDRTLGQRDYRFNNAELEAIGVEAMIAAASRIPAGRLGLGNTPDFLWDAERAAHGFARAQRLRGFTAYQNCFTCTQVRSFEELTGDSSLAGRLRELYRGIDNVEFLVGLFAQHHPDTAVLPPTLQAMVAVDAFSQIFTNPLMSRNVYGEDAFSRQGLAIIEETNRFQDLIARNAAPGAPSAFASFALTG